MARLVIVWSAATVKRIQGVISGVRGMDRRKFLQGLAAAGVIAPWVGHARADTTSNAAVRVVVVGAGAAGLSLVNRLRRALPKASVTLVDDRTQHVFQPGLTLVGAGLWQPNELVQPNAAYVPSGVQWVKERVAQFDPDANRVVSAGGTVLPYDFLFVATGLVLDYTAIQGMSEELIGKQGIASVYAGPQAALASANAIDAFIQNGGVGLFGRPSTEMKCAGAPLKMTFLTDDKARRRGRRDALKLVYNAHNDAVFSVAPVSQKVTQLFGEREISIHYQRVLTAIDASAKKASFATPNGTITLDYDFIHVVPPMRAPQAVRNSPLPWQTGPFAADGWVQADKATLRHPRYANVFSVGDVAGVPRGKTAASVKWQVPVVVQNLVDELNGKQPVAAFNGYTSCPLITRYGRAMLIEFDYDGKLVPSFPFIDPLEELWISWLIDEKALIGTYRAMLMGRA